MTAASEPPRAPLAQAGAIVLGSGAGGGVPQWNCRCAVCDLAWTGDLAVWPRSQAGLAVSGDGVTWILLNASPDLGAQLRATPALHPAREGRSSPITAVVLTGGEVDETAGLLSLREQHPFLLVALAAVHGLLDANPMFEVLDRRLVRRLTAHSGEWLALPGGLAVELFAVPGKPPLYAEGNTSAPQGVTAGVLVTAPSGSRLAYLPSCLDYPAPVLETLARADILLIDGTVYTDDELIRAGVGNKTGRRMGHMPLSGEHGALQRLAELPAERKILTHINNTNRILIAGSAESESVQAAGFEVAFDGMEIAL